VPAVEMARCAKLEQSYDSIYESARKYFHSESTFFIIPKIILSNYALVVVMSGVDLWKALQVVPATLYTKTDDAWRIV
jgi:hypothetical protein